jgi:tetratricopeptide (TPR) repeat protein
MTLNLSSRLADAVNRHEAGCRAEAERLCLALIAERPDWAEALHFYGVLCVQSGRGERAVKLIAAAARQEPFSSKILENLARAQIAVRRDNEVEASLRRAVALEPAGTCLAMLGALFKRLKRFGEAASFCRRAMLVDPSDVGSRFNYAAVLEALGQAGAAAAQFRRIAVVDPSAGSALLNIARMAQEREDWPAAAAALARLSNLRPERFDLRQQLVTVLAAQGRMAAAAAALVETGRLGRLGRCFWKTAYYHLIRICNELLAAGRDDSAAALIAAAETAWRDDDAELRAWALFLSGSLALRRGDLPRARGALTQARPYLPFLAHIAVGDIFRRRGEGLPSERLAESAAALRWEATAARPGPGAGLGPVVFVACDAGYLRRFAPLFLAVLDRFAALGQAAHLHIVDPAPDAAATVAGLAAGLRRVRLGWSCEASPVGLTPEGRKTYYTFVRFLRLNEIAARYPGAGLLVADIDACVLADPAAFIAALSPQTPLALQYFPENLARIYDGVGGGLVVLLPEPAVTALFERVRRFLLSWTAERRVHYFLDQMALVAGVDDAISRKEAPGILRIGVEGRVFRCGDGRFAQILDEKQAPDFAGAAAKLTAELIRDGEATDAVAERARILTALGIPV